MPAPPAGVGAIAPQLIATGREDSGAVNVGQPGAHATHHAHIIAVDPRNPRQLIRGWFSWRGAEFNDPKFGAEAEAFFASFQRAGGNAPKPP